MKMSNEYCVFGHREDGLLQALLQSDHIGHLQNKGDSVKLQCDHRAHSWIMIKCDGCKLPSDHAHSCYE